MAAGLDIQSAKDYLSGTPSGRKLLSRNSCRYYSKYYLDIDLWPHQVRWLDFLRRKQRGGILAPVAHGKTRALQVLVTRIICENRNIRILIVSGTVDHAKKNLAVIKQWLKNNARIKEDYGEFYHKDNTWDKLSFTVIRDQNLTDPTVQAIGAYGEITGGRFDLILLDDLVTAKNSLNETQCRKLIEFFDGTIDERLDKKGMILFIGTRKHYLDLYSKFLSQRMIWQVLVEKAIIEEPEDYELIELQEPELDEDDFEIYYKVVIKGAPGKVLDPVNRPMEYLLLRRHGHGSRLFNREYQNEITSDENAIIKLEWMEKCRDYDLSYADIEFTFKGDRVTVNPKNIPDLTKYTGVIMGTDPSIVIDKASAEKANSSYMVTVVGGIYENGDVDFLYIFRRRGISPNQKAELAKHLNQIFNPVYHFWERNSFGILDINKIKTETGVPIVPHLTSKNKSDSYEGIPRLSVNFENQKFHLAYRTERDKKITDEYIAEFHAFPEGEHDDQVLGTWIFDCGKSRFLNSMKKMRQRDGRNA